MKIKTLEREIKKLGLTITKYQDPVEGPNWECYLVKGPHAQLTFQRCIFNDHANSYELDRAYSARVQTYSAIERNKKAKYSTEVIGSWSSKKVKDIMRWLMELE